MNTAIYSLAASSIAKERSLEVLANNLANINTPGFKAERPIFKTYLAEARDPSLMPASAPGATAQIQTPMVMFETMRVDFSAGAFQHTGNDLDLAIDGSGFFAVQTPDGVRYTRQGNFTLAPDGRLVNGSGFPVMGARGPLVLRGGKMEVAADGRISVDGNQVDRLMIVDFPTPYNLAKDVNGLFTPGGSSEAGEPVDAEANLKQGYIELSNVNPIRELVRLIETSRAIESYQKSIQRLLGDQGVLSRSATSIGRLG